jgi:hypothetical protein
MKDKLREALKATDYKNKIQPPEIKNQFTLISYSTLSLSHYDIIRKLQEWVNENYNISIPVIGGGYGCSLITFEIIADSHSNAVEFIKAMMEDDSFHDKAREASFRILIIKKPWTRVDLARGTIEGGEGLADYIDKGITMNIDKSTNINAPVTGSAVTAGSSNVTQTININSNLEGIINQIIEKAETDDAISKKDYSTIIKEIEVLKCELQEQKPKKAVVERVLSNLGSVVSITSFIDKLVPFLPTLF